MLPARDDDDDDDDDEGELSFGFHPDNARTHITVRTESVSKEFSQAPIFILFSRFRNQT